MILIRIQISHGVQREDKLESEIQLNHSRTNISHTKQEMNKSGDLSQNKCI
jgi:hypothetical protein